MIARDYKRVRKSCDLCTICKDVDCLGKSIEWVKGLHERKAKS